MKKLPDVYIDVYMPIAGWKARMMARDDDCGGMHTPWQTAPFAFTKKSDARRDAMQWAKAEGVPFIETCPDNWEDAPEETVEEQLQDILGPIEVIHLD